MNQKISNILHIFYASIYLILLLVPIYLIYSPIKFYLKNNLNEYILGSLFSIETLLSILALILLVISMFHNIKLRRRQVISSHKNFIILTAIALVIAAFPFIYSHIIQDPYAVLLIIYTGPFSVIIWLITIVMGFSLLKK